MADRSSIAPSEADSVGTGISAQNNRKVILGKGGVAGHLSRPNANNITELFIIFFVPSLFFFFFSSIALLLLTKVIPSSRLNWIFLQFQSFSSIFLEEH